MDAQRIRFGHASVTATERVATRVAVVLSASTNQYQNIRSVNANGAVYHLSSQACAHVWASVLRLVAGMPLGGCCTVGQSD